MFSNTIEAGLIPNDTSKAAHNSLKLEEYRKVSSEVNWLSVRDQAEPDYCFYHLANSVKMRNGECWRGAGIYTQLYFHSPTDYLVQLGSHSTVTALALINIDAFKRGQKRIGVGITDGKLHGYANAKRWVVDNVSVQWCEHGMQFSNTWIGSVRDCYLANNHNCFHIPIGGQAISISVAGGEFGGNCTGRGIHVTGNMTNCSFTSVTVEANALGGVLHEGLNAKVNNVYDSCYFESNGYYGSKGSLEKQVAAQFVIDSPADTGTRLIGCGFYDPDVPSYEAKQGYGFVADRNWHMSPNIINGRINSRNSVWGHGIGGYEPPTQEQVQVL